MIKRLHKATQIALKEAEIDDGIKPIIDWLNSYETAITAWSCEGDKNPNTPPHSSKKSVALPYVYFSCSCSSDLSQILKMIDRFHAFYSKTRMVIWVNAQYDDSGYSPVGYHMGFYSKTAMLNFIKYLNKHS